MEMDRPASEPTPAATRRCPWRTAVVALLLAEASACGGNRVVARPAPAPISRPVLTVSERTEVFVDTSRSTDPVGDTPGSAVRTLPTLITSPASGQPGRPYPLIVFAHGNGGTNRSDIGLQRAWAAAGYVVVAPTFPFGAGRAPDQATGAADHGNQPGDMSFVVSEVLRLARDPTDPLSGIVDPDRIGAAGHSLGGSTTLALAGHTCCHDPRIKAAVVLAGGELFGAIDFWIGIRTPMLYVHGDADPVVAYKFGQDAYDHTPPPRFLLTILGGDHGEPYTGSAENPQARVVVTATLEFFDAYLGGHTDDLDRLTVDGNVPAVSRIASER
jgi:dienelactone hydrolase